MSSLHSPQPFAQSSLAESLSQVPQTFADAIAQVQTAVLEVFDREVAEKQLCYHTREHVMGVQQRARKIFQIIYPGLPASQQGDRQELLLDLCAVAHDLIQIFVPSAELHTTRRRAAGVSERATIEKLFKIIHRLNQQHSVHIAQFTETDLQIIREAIEATICDYNPTEQAIYQPALYRREQAISPVARTLALADIGTLGMEGIEAYNLEGSLLFLEENPDVRSLVESHQMEALTLSNPILSENIRQRLLRRTKFQVNFAKSRVKCCPQELEGFPPDAIPALMQHVFQHLTPETVEAIESTTPTADDTSLQSLIHFFQFDQVISGMSQ